MPKLIAGCLGLAALSLLLPSQPAYDPMAWLVWGREIAHGGLDTAGGSSWKPLPVLFTVAFAPLSALDDSIPPALWMVVARTGALLALALAFRLVFRLAGGGPAGAAGGAAAAAALFLLPDWLQFVAHGSEAPWAVALMLWAVERHMDGARRARSGARSSGLPAAARADPLPRRLCGLALVRGAAAARPQRRIAVAAASWRGWCPTGSARETRSTVAARRAASPSGASPSPTSPGCGPWSALTSTRG